MDPELRELFELKDDNNEKGDRKPPEQNVLRHATIRLAVFIAGTIVFGIAMSQAKGWGALGILMYMMIFHAVCLLFIIIETPILKSNNKPALANVNIIFIVILLLIYGISAISIFGAN
ncbi:MAG: hypothetical protein LBE92_12720 [Chryseobacterium sp.]|jgi:hypothetical protein|uniref:hypothetical protein n=1 Tax=Chryseobacterium sp. TaxID=1871047 RepID=UPI0028256BC2|nr:hypothetical protein [Chryseobacterium sp.]MDR2236977.1 hypothetical protein [Chryseobacterium sp.]